MLVVEFQQSRCRSKHEIIGDGGGRFYRLAFV